MLISNARKIIEKPSKEMKKIEKLEAENKALKLEVKSLKAEVKRLNKVDNENENLKKQLAQMKLDIKSTVFQAVCEAVAPIEKALNEANNEIKRLNVIIDKDSSNSNKPSSTNGFKHVPNSREKTGRSQGGQKGHKGHRLSLPDNLDELEAEGVIERRIVDYTGGATDYVIRHTLDVETRVILTEHRFKVGEILPGMYNEVTYGDEIKGLSVVLMNEGIIAKKRLTEIISGMTSGVINLSTGTLETFQKEFAEKLDELNEIEVIETDLINDDGMNVDDTPLRVLERPAHKNGELIFETTEDGEDKILLEKGEGKTLSATLRTYVNERSVRYTINPSKHQVGIDRDDILPRFNGNLTHDDESKFHHYGKNNSLCGAHLLRELRGIEQAYKFSWAGEVRDLFIRMNSHKNADLEKGVTACDKQILAAFVVEFENLLAKGVEAIENHGYNFGFKQVQNIVARVQKRKDNYLLFMRDYSIPFTNNRAEAALRPEKIKQKVSGMFRSWGGVLTHVNIRSFIATAKKREKNVFTSVKKIFAGQSVLSN